MKSSIAWWGKSSRPASARSPGPALPKKSFAAIPRPWWWLRDDRDAAQQVQREFASRALRLYTSNDVVGVELGGSVKNVIAVAAGVVEGLGLGHNPTAALITRGLAEMTRLACACGAKRETLAGLAGMGDLVLTCTGDLSRNRTVGVELGKGRKLADIIGSMRMVAEGVKTTEATVALAEKTSRGDAHHPPSLQNSGRRSFPARGHSRADGAVAEGRMRRGLHRRDAERQSY